MTASVRNRIACLDGLRGLAALWVLIGHALLLTDFALPVVDEPDLGVDLFIMLSGFLMVFHYQLKQWSDRGTTIAFLARRYFRLAPLFYFMLAIALVAGPYLYDCRMQIDAFRAVHPQEAYRYLDASIANIFFHISFLFGFLPDYAFRTPLPDWSLGLEMQFYVFFPLMMLGVHRFGWVRAASFIVVAGLIAALGLWLRGTAFPMPSFLPLKMHIFMCGMLCAASLGKDRRFAVVAGLVSALLIALPIGGHVSLERLVVREVLLLIFYVLVLHDHFSGWLGNLFSRLSSILGTPPFHWAGELSYSAYLIHLIIMQPVVAYVLTVGSDLSALSRFLIVIAVVLPVTYTLSFITYTQIEKRGNALGARLLKRFDVRAKDAVMSPAEQIAAP